MMMTCLIGLAVGIRSTLLSGSGPACAAVTQANAEVNAARHAAARRGRLANPVIECLPIWRGIRRPTRGTLVTLHDACVSVLCTWEMFRLEAVACHHQHSDFPQPSTRWRQAARCAAFGASMCWGSIDRRMRAVDAIFEAPGHT